MGLKEQLQKDKLNLAATPQYVANDKQEGVEDSIFWGRERTANRRAVMLDLRLKGGKFVSLPYSYMTKIDFDPSESLELYIAGNHVKITGRNMHHIYNYLCLHKVTFIAANLTDIDIADESDTYVNDITVEKIDY